MRVASFDIGKKNFAFCVEEFDDTQLGGKMPSNPYNSDGSPTEEMTTILNTVYQSGRLVLHENLDLTYNCDKKMKLDPQTFYNMVEQLDKYREFWQSCDIFIIEEQMSFGRSTNTMAVKLGQHCFSYFVIKYPGKKVMEFHAYHKTQVLGAKKIETRTKKGKVKWVSMDKPKRKKWSIENAKIILEARGEVDILTNLKTVKKKDDLADVLNQLQAFKVLQYYK